MKFVFSIFVKDYS